MSDIAKVAPSGVWFKTHIYKEGHMLHGVTYMVCAGTPEVFRASVDLRPIAKAVARAHARLHQKGVAVSGFPGNVFKAVKSIGKSKIVKSIGKGVKSVVRSKVTGALVSTAAVVYPPVGIPAATAYATANQALDAIDRANQAKRVIEKNVPGTAKFLRGIDSPNSPSAKVALKTPVKLFGKVPLAVPAGTPQALKTLLQKKPALKNLFLTSAKAKSALSAISQKARAGDPEAKAAARIVNIAHTARTQVGPKPEGMKTIAKGAFPALLIDRRGAVIPGQFIDRSKDVKGQALVLSKGQILRGAFDKIGCGSSNPMSRPPALR